MPDRGDGNGEGEWCQFAKEDAARGSSKIGGADVRVSSAVMRESV